MRHIPLILEESVHCLSLMYALVRRVLSVSQLFKPKGYVHNFLRGLIFCVLVFISVPGHTAGGQDSGDQNNNIEIFSDELHYFPNEDKAIFIGNVQVQQKEIKLESDRMVVFIEGGQQYEQANQELPKDSKIKRIDLEGKVHIITPTEEALANRGEYMVDTGIVVLYDNVKLMQEGGWITGEKFIHNRNSGESVMHGAVKKQRVRGYFAPKEGQNAR